MTAMLLWAAGGPPARGATAALGDPDFYPSPQRPVGFRGDRTGRYPAARPPLHW